MASFSSVSDTSSVTEIIIGDSTIMATTAEFDTETITSIITVDPQPATSTSVRVITQTLTSILPSSTAGPSDPHDPAPETKTYLAGVLSWAIAGAVIAAIILCALIYHFQVFSKAWNSLRRWRRRRKEKKARETEVEMMPSAGRDTQASKGEARTADNIAQVPLRDRPAKEPV